MRVLVTGHLGYIGTVMVPMLLKAGHQVIGFDCNLYEKCTFVAGGNLAMVPHIRKDVRDATKEDFRGIDAVIHLGSVVQRPPRQPEPGHHLRHQSPWQRACGPSAGDVAFQELHAVESVDATRAYFRYRSI